MKSDAKESRSNLDFIKGGPKSINTVRLKQSLTSDLNNFKNLCSVTVPEYPLLWTIYMHCTTSLAHFNP